MLLSDPIRLDGTLGAMTEPILKLFGPLPLEASAAHSSIYIYDLVDQRNLSLSASVGTLLGYTTETPDPAEDLSLAHLIHPADLDGVADHFQRFSTLQPGEVISLKYSMRHADGTWRWLHSSSQRSWPLATGRRCKFLALFSCYPFCDGRYVQPMWQWP